MSPKILSALTPLLEAFASERQWQDVLGVLRVQGDSLDVAYMKTWASELHVADLLERAFFEAGVIND